MCSHAAALLFAIEDFVSRGYRELPDGPAATELLCKWNMESNTKVKPLPISELRIRKPDPRKRKHDSSDVQDLPAVARSMYDPRDPEDKCRSIGKLKWLYKEMSLASPHCGWVDNNKSLGEGLEGVPVEEEGLKEHAEERNRLHAIDWGEKSPDANNAKQRQAFVNEGKLQVIRARTNLSAKLTRGFRAG